MDRGIVITPKVDSRDIRSISIGGDYVGSELSRYLLYWDKIAYVTTNAARPWIDDLPDFSFLLSEGHCIRRHYQLRGESKFVTDAPIIDGVPMPMIPFLLLDAQAKAVEELTEETGIIWTADSSYVQYCENLLAQEKAIISANIFLSKELPVPVPNTPLVDVIEFRNSRRAELLALRHALDELRTSIDKSENSRDSFIRAEEKIVRSILEIEKAFKDKRINTIPQALSVVLNSRESQPLALIATALCGVDIKNHPRTSLAIIGTSCFLQLVNYMQSKKPDIPSQFRDFAYLFHAIDTFR